ncbi:MAG: antirepressor, partial [Bacteroidetes bacterium RIFCSPLOWO2_02_FULL_36_8]
LATNCSQLKMQSADGKFYLTDVADTEQLFRLIQSIPSPKAEPFKLWLAQVASERLDEMQDPELTIDRAMKEYLQLGYSESWINQRLKSIEIRKELTDEWKKRGLKEGVQFATLTDIITKAWSDRTTKEYKILKGLKKENLRDNMTNTELILNMLAEASTKEISSVVEPKDFDTSIKVAKQGGDVAKVARKELEARTGKKVVTSLNAKAVLSLKERQEK